MKMQCKQCGRSGADLSSYETEDGYICAECSRAYSTGPERSLLDGRFSTCSKPLRCLFIALLVVSTLVSFVFILGGAIEDIFAYYRYPSMIQSNPKAPLSQPPSQALILVIFALPVFLAMFAIGVKYALPLAMLTVAYLPVWLIWMYSSVGHISPFVAIVTASYFLVFELVLYRCIGKKLWSTQT